MNAAAPSAADAAVDAGLRALQSGNAPEAERQARTALQLQPDHLRGLQLLARLLRERSDAYEEYLQLRRRIAEGSPQSAPAWELYAWALQRGEFKAEAAQAMDRVLSLQPDNLAARWDRFQQPRQLVFPDAASEQAFVRDWTAGLEWFEAHAAGAAAANDANLAEVLGASSNFHLHYRIDDALPLQLRYARMVEALACRAFGAIGAPRCPPRRRLRIGFVSAHLHRHTVSKLFGSLIESADRQRFEIVLIALDCEQLQIVPELRQCADLIVSGQREPAAWLHAAGELACDVLIHLDIGMHPLSQVLAAFRLAPFQAMLWGHPVTSGFSSIDAFFTSQLMEPADGDAHYRETLLRLPGLGTCYRRPAAVEALSIDAPAGTTRYLVAQSVHKLRPSYDSVLADIAGRDPQAHIVLLSHQRKHVAAALLQRVRREFARRDVDPARVTQLPRLSEAQFIGLAPDIDVVLDSHDWSGGNTTLELAAAGAPTLTLPGSTLRSRHGLAINQQMGLDELIADDRDDFVQRAVALGSDPERRAGLRATLTERSPALFDDRRVAVAFWQQIENALLQ